MKTLRIIGTALVAVVLGAGLCACSDDDDDDASSGGSSSSGGSAPSADISVINATDGDRLLLTSIGSVLKFDYDEQGRCTYIYDRWSDFDYRGYDYKISYSPYKVVMVEEDDEEDEEYDDIDELKLTFNSSGYLSKISWGYSYSEPGYECSESETWNLSYDGDDQLTKITESYSMREVEDGERYTYTGSSTTALTWIDGNMTEASRTLEDSASNGDEWYGTGSYTCEYGNSLNECRQHTLAMYSAYYAMDFFGEWGFIGYLGKGTLNHPAHYEWEYKEWCNYDDIVFEESGSNSPSYTMNSNGTIRTETAGGETYTYSYTTLDAATRGAAPTLEDALSAPWNSEGKTRRMPGLRGRHHAKPGAAGSRR